MLLLVSTFPFLEVGNVAISRSLNFWSCRALYPGTGPEGLSGWAHALLSNQIHLAKSATLTLSPFIFHFSDLISTHFLVMTFLSIPVVVIISVVMSVSCFNLPSRLVFKNRYNVDRTEIIPIFRTIGGFHSKTLPKTLPKTTSTSTTTTVLRLTADAGADDVVDDSNDDVNDDIIDTSSNTPSTTTYTNAATTNAAATTAATPTTTNNSNNIEEDAINSFKALTTNQDNADKDANKDKDEYTFTPPPTPPPPPSLLLSLTSVESQGVSKESSKGVIKLPLLGSLPLDGSLLLAVPAAVIGVLGVLTALYVAINSADELGTALKSTNLSPAEKRKADVGRGDKVCRGLCYDQDEDLEQKAKRIKERGVLEIFF